MGVEPAVSLDRIGMLELFRSLPAEALEEVRLVMRIERVAKDVAIFRQGDLVSRAYALDTGSVRIVQSGSDGGQAIVRFIGPGEMFGTVPLFTDHRFPADAVTVEASRVLTWSEPDLSSLMARYPGIAINLIRALGVRMAQLQERVRELTTQRVEQRIAQAILRLAAQSGRSGARNDDQYTAAAQGSRRVRGNHAAYRQPHGRGMGKGGNPDQQRPAPHHP